MKLWIVLMMMIFSVNMVYGWNITSATYTEQVYVGGKESSPNGLFFRSDGLKVFTIGSSGDSVDEYDLGTAWNVTTATYIQEISVLAQDGIYSGLFFRSDGLKMYLAGASGDSVDEYDLGTAWNVTTATYIQEISISASETNIADLFFRSDGLKMYIIGSAGLSVDEYDLGTAWNVTTATYIQEISVSTKCSLTGGLFFRSDGLKMFTSCISGINDAVDEYDLGTAWNVTTATYLQNMSLTETGGQGLFFRSDGLKMYVIESASDFINEYTLSNNYSCVPLWVCDGYGDCQFGDQRFCTGASDSNVCGVSYSGNLSEFTQSCTFCVESWQVSYSGSCSGLDRVKFYVDVNNCGTYSSLPSDNGTSALCDVSGGGGGGSPQVVSTVVSPEQSASTTSAFSNFINSIIAWFVGLFS